MILSFFQNSADQYELSVTSKELDLYATSAVLLSRLEALRVHMRAGNSVSYRGMQACLHDTRLKSWPHSNSRLATTFTAGLTLPSRSQLLVPGFFPVTRA